MYLKFFLFLSIFLFFDSYLVAQNSSYFNCIWHELGISNGPANANFRMRIDSDSTIINEKIYYGILTSNELEGENFSGSFDFVRFEGDKIYSITQNNNQEYLLYDFGANIGEVIETQYNMFQVESIDSVLLLDGSYRKTLTVLVLNNQFITNTLWIEGIGDILGFRNPKDLEASGMLCHYKYEELLFQNENYNSCWLLTNTEDVGLVDNYYNVSYSPKDKILLIDNKHKELDKIQIVINDIRGRIIFSKQTNIDYQLDIDLSNLGDGLYFYSIRKSNLNQTGKLFVK